MLVAFARGGRRVPRSRWRSPRSSPAVGLLAFASRLAPTCRRHPARDVMIGLAVGVDYCLFYHPPGTRRTAQRRRSAPGAGDRRARPTAGRSGCPRLTVIVAMAGFLHRDTPLSFAVGHHPGPSRPRCWLAHVLPAVLSALGDRVDSIRSSGLYRRAYDGRIWAWVSRVLARRCLHHRRGRDLAIIALPALDLRTRARASGTVAKAADRQAGMAMRTRSRRRGSGPRSSFVPVGALAELRRLEPVRRGPDQCGGYGRDRPVPRSGHQPQDPAGPVPGTVALVTGDEGRETGLNQQLEDSVPWVFGVLGLAFLLLLVSFRSWPSRSPAVVLQPLSVAAAYGMLVVVFQYGHFASSWTSRRPAGSPNWMPLFLFSHPFGLSWTTRFG